MINDSVAPSATSASNILLRQINEFPFSNQPIEEGDKMSKPDFSKLPASALYQWRDEIDERLERLREVEAKAIAIAKANEVEDLKARYIEMANTGWHVSHAE